MNVRKLIERFLIGFLLLATVIFAYGWFLTQVDVAPSDNVSLMLGQTYQERVYPEGSTGENSTKEGLSPEGSTGEGSTEGSSTQEGLSDRVDRVMTEAEYDGNIRPVGSEELAEARLVYEDVVQRNGYGTTFIPSVGLKLPLLAGSTHSVLLSGVGSDNPNQRLGEGLFVGMSHNRGEKELLGPISRVNTGNLVYFTDFEKVYTYQVDYSARTHMREGDMLIAPEPGETPRFTLYRCIGVYDTVWRWVISGELVDVQPVEQVDNNILVGLGLKRAVRREVAVQQEVKRPQIFTQVNASEPEQPEEPQSSDEVEQPQTSEINGWEESVQQIGSNLMFSDNSVVQFLNKIALFTYGFVGRHQWFVGIFYVAMLVLIVFL